MFLNARLQRVFSDWKELVKTNSEKLVLSKRSRRNKSALVLAALLQQRKCKPLQVTSVTQLSACFQMWKSFSSDVLRQYDGLYANIQIAKMVHIFQKLVVKQ